MFDGGIAEETLEISPRARRGRSKSHFLEGKSARGILVVCANALFYYCLCLAELSGGYDSTLALSLVKKPHVEAVGFSVEFPFYEFRFEAPAQRIVAESLGVKRTAFSGLDLFPFSPWTRAPRFDEPSLFVTGIRHAERAAEFAARHKAAKLYTGHGGDHLFNLDLTKQEPLAGSLELVVFSTHGWYIVNSNRKAFQKPKWRERKNGLFVYDARRDVWIKETFGVTLRTPFTDLAVFQPPAPGARSANQRTSNLINRYWPRR